MPTHVIACIGGGSNAIGAFYHFLENSKVQLIGVEAAGKGLKSGKSAATLALGSTGILHACMTQIMQTKDGQVIEPHSISAGLDYPGIGPIHAHLDQIKRVHYGSVTDNEAIQAAMQLCQLEGIIPALESAHALAYLNKIQLNTDDRIVINLSGRGDKDMNIYNKQFQA